MKLWCKTGILFSLAIYISQIPFPKGNASVKALSLGFVAVLWLAKMILEKRFTFIRTRLWWPLIILSLITLLSVIGSIDVEYSLKNIKKYTFVSVFLYFAIVNNVQNLKDVKILLLALMISAGIFSLLALIDYSLFEQTFGSRLRVRYLDRNLGRFSKFYDLVIPINFALIFITKDNIKKTLYVLSLLLSMTTMLLMQMRGSYVVIEAIDDGRGIDVEKIRKKAIEKGLFEADSDIENKEVINLVFSPGFSTKEIASEISGRGVGLDVVKEKISMLGGFTEISTERDEGSTFTLTHSSWASTTSRVRKSKS